MEKKGNPINKNRKNEKWLWPVGKQNCASDRPLQLLKGITGSGKGQILKRDQWIWLWADTARDNWMWQWADTERDNWIWQWAAQVPTNWRGGAQPLAAQYIYIYI